MLTLLGMRMVLQNVATLEGGYSLAPSWVDGPFEAQAAQVGGLL